MKAKILKGTGGLKTETDPVRSNYDPEIGIWDLAACINIDISDTYRISRRKGMVRKLAGDAKGLFPVENRYCLFCVADALCRLEPSLTDYTPIATVTPGNELSVVVVDGKAYWCNGHEKGVVIDGINQTWVASAPLVGSNITRVFSDPPVGSLLAYHNGLIYVVDGRTIWYSEPYAPDWFSKGDCFLSFESDVQMIRPVEGGIFVSDEKRVWYLRGKNPKEFYWSTADNTSALMHSDEQIQMGITLDQTGKPVLAPGMGTKSAVWLTQKGVCYGGGEGRITQLTERKIDLPGEYSSGATLVNGATLIGQFN